jgi:hypothetical protein
MSSAADKAAHKSPYKTAHRAGETPQPDELDDEQDAWKLDNPVAAYDAAMKSIGATAKPRKPKKKKGGSHYRRGRDMHKSRLDPDAKPSVEVMRKKHLGE